MAGAPINLTNGNVYITQQDYAIPGLGGGLALQRTWNSQWRSSPHAGAPTVRMFGDSWTSHFEERLAFVDSQTIDYWRGDGSKWRFSYLAFGFYGIIAPNITASLSYDSASRHYVLTVTGVRTLTFDAAGHLLSVADLNHNTTSLTYDGSGRLTQVTDAASRTLTFIYGDPVNPGVVTSVQDAVGLVATYQYDNAGRLLVVTYADGSFNTFNYDLDSQIISVTDTDGKVLETHTYDGSRRGLLSSRADGVEALTVSYGGVPTLTDSLGHLTSYTSTTINQRNEVTGVTGVGCATCGGRGNHAFTYDTAGNRTSSTDQNNNLTQLTYDSSHNVTQRSNVVNGTTIAWNFTYNNLHEVLTAIDPLSNVTTNTYDANGNLLTTTTPSPDGGHTAGSKTTFTYDAKGQLLTVSDPLIHVTTLTYTAAGLVQTVKDAQNHVTTYEYDLRGNRTAIVDALNQRTTFDYDARNRLTSIHYPTTPVTSTTFAYDHRGRRTSVTDPNNKTTTYVYDDADRLTSVTDAANQTTSYAYDTEDHLTSITDAMNRVTQFQYDADGRVTQTTFPSNLTETYAYDAAGNLTSKTDRKLQTITSTYDALNRLKTKQYPDSTSVTYTYDAASRLSQVADPTGVYTFTYDRMGRLTQTATAYSFISGRTFTVGYAYDAASNTTSMTDPQSGATTYTYDTVNRLATLKNPQRNQFTFTYDALNRRTQLARPNTVNTNYTYDTLSRVTALLHQVTTRQGTTTLDGATYTYDNAGNRLSRRDNRTNLLSTFGYDPIYQLTGVTQGTTTTEQYTYDPVGSRLSSLGVSPYAYNLSNELTDRPGAVYGYDDNGSETTKVEGTATTQYVWDAENRLTRVLLAAGGQVDMKYDPFGRRIQKASASATTNYVYDGANVLEEVDASGNLVARYTQNLGIDEPLALLRSGVTSYYEADGLGSVTSLSNSSGALANTYTYDSFGKQTASSGTVVNPYRFTGREFDAETGLMYYRARFFDSQTGRFVSEDPWRFRAGTNFYGYANDNPISWIDPLGLSGWLTVSSSGTTGLGNHSWISYTPDGGTATTYGTWGPGSNPNGTGLLTNQEVGRPSDASRMEYLNDAQEAQLMALIEQYQNQGANGWQLGRPCSSFAADAWKRGTGETLNTRWGPISNPSTLTNSILRANGGQANVTVRRQPNGSSSWSKSYGFNSSSSSSSSGSSLNSSGSSLLP